MAEISKIEAKIRKMRKFEHNPNADTYTEVPSPQFFASMQNGEELKSEGH